MRAGSGATGSGNRSSPAGLARGRHELVECAWCHDHQRVAGAQHDVEPPVDGGGQVRPQTALDRDRQPFPPEPRRRDLDHSLAPVGRPHAEAPAGEHRRVDPGPAGSVEHVAARVWAAIAVRTRMLVLVISRFDDSPSTVIARSSCSDA